MQIEYQLQIDAIKGKRIYYIHYDNIIFVTNGHVGVYLKETELKLDKSKLLQPTTTKESVSFLPEDLAKERTPAIVTRVARKLRPSGYAIKLYSEQSGEHCYVDEKYLKMFKDCTSLYIKSRRDPVLPEFSKKRSELHCSWRRSCG